MRKISWWEPTIGNREQKLISSVLRSNFPNEGNLTTEFEQKIQKLLNVKYAIAVTSGTASIFLSLKALGIGYGDEVIVPDLTFIATANAVVMAGAKPILVDINPKTLTIDTERIKMAITSKTKAIIPVHVSGRAANMKEIMRTSREKNIAVIEDAAEGFMSRYDGKYLGTIGHTGCFSLSPAKVITTGQGGIIVTNDRKLALKLKEFKDQGRPKRGTGGDDIHYGIGFNFKFTDLQAALGIGQLDYLNKRLSRIKRTYQIYKENLKDIQEIQILDFDIKSGEVPQWIDALCERRDKLDKYLEKNGMYCRRFWHPIHKQKPYRLDDKKFPNTTTLSPHALWLPSSFKVTDEDVRKVCKKIKEFYSK